MTGHRFWHSLSNSTTRYSKTYPHSLMGWSDTVLFRRRDMGTQEFTSPIKRILLNPAVLQLFVYAMSDTLRVHSVNPFPHCSDHTLCSWLYRSVWLNASVNQLPIGWRLYHNYGWSENCETVCDLETHG